MAEEIENNAPASPGGRPSSGGPPEKTKKKKQSAADLQKALRASQGEGPAKAPVDFKKIFGRVGLVLLVVWIIAFIIPTWIPKAVAGALTAAAVGFGIWFVRYIKKSEALGDLLRGASTAEGRKEALEKLDKDFKKGDTQAVLARAQLEMQEDPRKALTTLETIQLDKVMTPIADQVRSMRGMLHLTLGEANEARALVDKIDLSKAQDRKSRAMFATVSAEAWARTGQSKKAIETLELFSPDDPELGEMRVQMLRARAFAYAHANDVKALARALRRLAETSPQLLGMFVGAKKTHPLLEREARKILMSSGAVPKKMVRQKM
ncbi:tetratricopeptide repeat protein [Pendulispora albinea]|uniref:Uncharacterized protein n=1 Tax=Pendulispora albinea TaxID=2741071 RepID=A0ABZ2M964_9BACT